MAESAATTSTVSPRTPGKRSANASPMLIESAPDDISESPTRPPALRAGGENASSTQPNTSLATQRTTIAVTAIHGSRGLS